MQTSRPSLVVSIHDVSPLTRDRVCAMRRDLAEIGVDRVSHLVIPNHHRRGALGGDTTLCAWLRHQVATGDEAVLHGYYHLRTEGPRTWLTERYTAGEGEFYDLGRDDARARLARGRAELAAAGLAPTGFIAPAWLLGAEAEDAVRAEKFSYTTRLRTFLDLERGEADVSQSLVWSVRAAWRRVVSLGWNHLLAHRLRGHGLLRVGLHPPDWDHPAIKAQVLRLLRTALAGREPITYDQWLARRRAKS